MPPLASPSGAQHRFRVLLLPGYYENTLKKYPVLYMHDGHNLFFKEEAFVGNTWRTDEVLNMLDKMNASEEVIVVFGKIACLSSTFTYRDNLLERVSAEPKRKIRI
jgi:predicted alpha/beta superfamily hydrolase